MLNLKWGVFTVMGGTDSGYPYTIDGWKPGLKTGSLGYYFVELCLPLLVCLNIALSFNPQIRFF